MPRITSKYWLRFGSLGVALIAIVIAGAANGSCVFDTTTNFCEQFGVRCKSGQQCAANEAVCIDIAGCGDGIMDPNKGEVCDDGNIENYIMADGMPVLVNGIPVLDDCSHDCKSTQKCGNHIMDFMEECDDGIANGMPGDFCTAECKVESNVCGNGVVEPDDQDREQCDPGAMDSMDCNSLQANKVKPGLGCKASRCGDGYTNMAALELCDTSSKDTVDCNGLKCTMSICGDGYVNKIAGEQCDDGSDTTLCNGNRNDNGVLNPANCHIARCGDGYTNGMIGETCDLGEKDTLTCNGNNKGIPNTASCHPPLCGDGYVNTALKETCDNVDGNDTDQCNGNKSDSGSQRNDPDAQCRLADCGDGYLNPSHIVFLGTSVKETCDTGGDRSNCNGKTQTVEDYNGIHTNNGAARCQPPSCGDGYINQNFLPGSAGPSQNGEECDDGKDGVIINGKLVKNDDTAPNACRTNCQAPHCGDHVKDDREGCDDGPQNSDTLSNACRTNCQAPHCGDRVKDDGEDCEPDPINPSDNNCGTNKHCSMNCHCVNN